MASGADRKELRVHREGLAPSRDTVSRDTGTRGESGPKGDLGRDHLGPKGPGAFQTPSEGPAGEGGHGTKPAGRPLCGSPAGRVAPHWTPAASMPSFVPACWTFRINIQARNRFKLQSRTSPMAQWGADEEPPIRGRAIVSSTAGPHADGSPAPPPQADCGLA